MQRALAGEHKIRPYVHMNQTVADLKKKGVKFQGKIEDVGPVLIATFADPEGNVMQVVQTKQG